MLSRAISYLCWIQSLAAKLNALLNARSAVLHTSGLFKQEFQLLQNMHLWHQTSVICYLLLCFVLHPESMAFIEKWFHWKFILQLSAWAKVYRWPVLNTICMPNTDLQRVKEDDISLWSWLLQRNNIQMCPLFRSKWRIQSASITPEEVFVGSCNWARKEKEPPEETDSFKECMIVHSTTNSSECLQLFSGNKSEALKMWGKSISVAAVSVSLHIAASAQQPQC